MQTQALEITTPVLTIEEKPSIAHLQATVVHSRKGVSQTTNLRITIAYQTDGQEIAYGIAFCSPRDNFNRRLGRTIAEGRFKKTPWILFNPTERNPLELIKETIESGGTNLPCYWQSVHFC